MGLGDQKTGGEEKGTLKRNAFLFQRNLLPVTKANHPEGLVVKNLPANAGDTGSISDPGRYHMPRGNEACVPQLLCPQTTETHPP